VTFQYVSVDEAIKRSGVRIVVLGGVPSPWGEAAKGILHVKNIEWAAVRLVYDSEPLKEWAGQRSGPILMYNNERPRAGWAEILLLSERLAPNPSLLPKDAADRALVFGLAHDRPAGPRARQTNRPSLAKPQFVMAIIAFGPEHV
jgi:hypothetical protein